MFLVDVAECFLNHQSETLKSILNSHPNMTYKDPSQDEIFLNEDQRKYIHAQILSFQKRLEDTQNAISIEKSRLEDDLHEIYKKGGEMSTDKMDKYKSLCATFESIRNTGVLFKEFFNLDFCVAPKEDNAGDSALTNFINNTTNVYTREQLVQFYDDEKEIELYLNLLSQDLIKESTASNVILEVNGTEEKKRKQYSLTQWSTKIS